MIAYPASKISDSYLKIIFASGFFIVCRLRWQLGQFIPETSPPPPITPPPVTGTEAGFPESLSVASPLASTQTPAGNASAQNQKLTASALRADKFSVFTADYDPTPEAKGELAGSYTYVWQAGC